MKRYVLTLECFDGAENSNQYVVVSFDTDNSAVVLIEPGPLYPRDLALLNCLVQATKASAKTGRVDQGWDATG